MVFYEAPHKLLATLQDMYACWGDRPIALVRELTKIHEEVLRTTLKEAIPHYEETPPRGEFVLVIGGAAPQKKAAITLDDGTRMAKALMEKGSSQSAAAKEIAHRTGLRRNELYEKLTKEV